MTGGSRLHRLNLVVTGRVQGVGFRYYTVERARFHGVAGWVKNRRDGNVEIEAEGSREALTAFLEDVRRGPPASRVARVSEDWTEAENPRHAAFDVDF